MKPIALAMLAGLAAPAAAQPPVIFADTCRISGSSDGDGFNQSTQQPLTLLGGGGAFFFLSANGGTGQTDGGLVDGLATVATSRMTAGANLATLPGGWTRLTFEISGEATILLPGYSLDLFSSLNINSDPQDLRIILGEGPQPVYFFTESAGNFSSSSGLKLNGAPIPSGTSITPGTYTLLEQGSGFVSVSNQTSHDSDFGKISAYFALPRCAAPLDWSQRASTGPAERYISCSAYDRARQRVVMFGGGTSVPLVRYNDVWEWDGVKWIERQPNNPADPNRPAPRRSAAMAYDSDLNKMYILAGETSAGFTKEFWRLDTATSAWTNLSASVPAGFSPRWGHCMVYDRERKVFVIYGGAGNGPEPTDTWEYNPATSTWTLKTPAANPGPRAAAAMVFDTLRGRTLIFGGGTSVLPPTDTPWVYDGKNWTALVTNLGPSSRYWPGMAFDEERGTILLMGGMTLPIVNETWELNNTTWTQRTTPAGNVARAGQAMAYHAGAKHIVSSGGINAALTYENDTWAYSWPQIHQHPVNQSVGIGQTATFTVQASQAATSFQWFKGQSAIIGANTATLQITNCQPSDAGSYHVVVGLPCGDQQSAVAILTVLACYANCDQSTTPPYLSPNDFVCFLGIYSNGSTAANCDGSTATPLLTPNDFICFIAQYAAGCS